MVFNHIKYISNVYNQIRDYKSCKIVCSSYPQIIAIEPTNACPMKCWYCPRKDMKRKIGFMDIELFKKIINQTRGYTSYIALEMFGDALLHPKIDEMIKYAHSKGIVVQISTNPCSLDYNVPKKLIDARLDILLLSLDAINPQTYNAFRGRPSEEYENACLNIHSFLKLKQGHNKPFVDIRMLGIPGLKEHFQQYQRDWSISGVDKVSLGAYHTWGGQTKGGMDRVIGRNHACYSAWGPLHIQWDGKVVPCCYDVNNTVVLGDLNNDTLLDVWNSKAMQNLRSESLDNKYTNALCSKCYEYTQRPDLFNHVINYNYQRNQHRYIVKVLRNAIKSR